MNNLIGARVSWSKVEGRTHGFQNFPQHSTVHLILYYIQYSESDDPGINQKKRIKMPFAIFSLPHYNGF